MEMQREYAFDLKLTKRMKQNQMLARGTVNIYRQIKNVFIRNILMKREPTVTINR